MVAVALNGEYCNIIYGIFSTTNPRKTGLYWSRREYCYDSTGAINSYIQSDNVVTQQGLNCAALAIFDVLIQLPMETVTQVLLNSTILL